MNYVDEGSMFMLKEQALDVVKRIEMDAPHLSTNVKSMDWYSVRKDQWYEEWYIELSGFHKTLNPVLVKNVGEWDLYKEFMHMQVMY